jgi:hypothetical protein
MMIYHSVNELVVMIAVDDSRALFGDILFIDENNIPKKELHGIPRQKFES